MQEYPQCVGHGYAKSFEVSVLHRNLSKVIINLAQILSMCYFHVVRKRCEQVIGSLFVNKYMKNRNSHMTIIIIITLIILKYRSLNLKNIETHFTFSVSLIQPFKRKLVFHQIVYKRYRPQPISQKNSFLYFELCSIDNLNNNDRKYFFNFIRYFQFRTCGIRAFFMLYCSGL